MNWQNIVVDQSILEPRLNILLADIFSVSPENVCIIERVEDFPPAGTKIIVCLISQLPPDFLMQLSIYVFFDKNTERKEFSSLSVAKSLCASGSVTCLISDDSENPYQFTMISGDRNTRKITVDPVALDEEGRYIVLM